METPMWVACETMVCSQLSEGPSAPPTNPWILPAIALNPNLRKSKIGKYREYTEIMETSWENMEKYPMNGDLNGKISEKNS